jgi:hypothetical protein
MAATLLSALNPISVHTRRAPAFLESEDDQSDGEHEGVQERKTVHANNSDSGT